MEKMLGRTYRKRNKRKTKMVKDSESTCKMNKSYNSICKWMGEKGYKSSKTLKPKIFTGYGRGLLTKEAIYPGDVIIAIPQNLLITSELVLQSEVGSLIKKYYKTATGHEILSLFLMVERAKGKLSEWHPYIDSLPESYSIPAIYGNKCLQSMPSFIYAQAAKQVKTVENSFLNLKELIRHLECLLPYLRGNLDFRTFQWAWCTVNTRCVFVDCFKKDCVGKSCKFHLALAPFLDFLNHSVDVQVRAGFNKNSQQYEIVSLCKCKRYSQVFINYGSHDNSFLLLEYGFVVPNNYNDTISFSIDDIAAAYQQCGFPSNFLTIKLQFILENNLIQNSVCSCDGLSWNLNTILKILTTDYDIRWWKSRLSNYVECIDGDKFKKLRKKLISVKLKEFTNNSIISHDRCEYTSLELQITQLLSIFCTILINAME